MGYAWPETSNQGKPRMNDSIKGGAAALAEFVRATQDAEFDDDDTARITNLLANTKNTLAALAGRPRFDAEPAEIVVAMRRLAPAQARSEEGAS